MRAQTEIGSILREYGEKIETLGLNSYQLRILRSLRHCRSAALGGYIDACTECGTVRVSYNSCRNRHCPKCQGNKRASWIEAKISELLPVPYFHVVFTLPSELNGICMGHPKEVYTLLFQSAWETLRQFGRGKGISTGMVTILHTWEVSFSCKGVEQSTSGEVCFSVTKIGYCITVHHFATFQKILGCICQASVCASGSHSGVLRSLHS